MLNYTSDKQLSYLIKEMQQQRDTQDTWDEDNEQILMFLLELEMRRKTDAALKEIIEGRDSYLSRLHDKMQDEKGLLIK